MWISEIPGKQINRRDLCLKYIAEKKRDRGDLLLHFTPAKRLHAVHSFPPRRAHSRRRPSPIRFFSGKYRHKSLCAHFPRICSKTPTHINGITGSGRQNRQHRLSSVGSLPSVILLICMGESVQDGSGGAKDRDLRLEYMYAKSTVLPVPTTTVSVTRRKQMEIQGCFREREVEEAGRQALLFV